MGKQNGQVADKSIATSSADLNGLNHTGVNRKRKKINFFKRVVKLLFYDYYHRKIGDIKKTKNP